METGDIERTIPVNRRAVLIQLFMLALVLGVVYFLPRRTTIHPGIILAPGALLLLYLVWPMLRAFTTGVAIEITSLGIVNHVGGVTFVAWDEIRDARIGSPWGQKVVELDLRNRDAVLRRIGSYRGVATRKYVMKYGGKPSIYAYLAEGGAEAVLAEIRSKLDVRGAG